MQKQRMIQNHHQRKTNKKEKGVQSFMLLLLLVSVDARPPPNVLVVMSSSSRLPLQGGKFATVGYFLDELTIPSMAMQRAGFILTFTNPLGNTPPMDER